ncbi:hypothetical protein [Bradyrhizobium prioriisuperbiae]|uniref:hypothetical protein n=1 Tax=Bradyrhizobium prioriisuperbiae TaxID=2854389 RepID=UPI0028E222EC|nr:hypothetical protein [Bradyrhizobium prioritasuperba]
MEGFVPAPIQSSMQCKLRAVPVHQQEDRYVQSLFRQEESAATGVRQRRTTRQISLVGHPDEVACNFAFSHLVHNLRARMTIDGRIHAETYLAAGGVIAGFAAQRALFATNNSEALRQMHIVTTQAGDKYFYGDPLNTMLLGGPDVPANERLWPLAAGGAVAAGLAQDRLPRVEDMFAHVAKSIGTENEGLPSVSPKNVPHLSPKELLRQLWPVAMTCFTGRFPAEAREYGIASTHFWPAITGHLANAQIQEVRPVLDPQTSLVILMETAIYASKLDLAALDTPPSA